MSSYSKLKSHPNKYLEDHLLNVAIQSRNFCKNMSIKDENLFADISFLIGIAHDFAKSTTFFQNYLLKSEKSMYSRHGFLSAVFGYYIVKNYIQKENIASEFDLPSLAYIVIVHHHGNIKNISDICEKVKKNSMEVGIKQIANIEENLNDNENTLFKFYNDYNIDLKDFINDYSVLIDEIDEKLCDLIFNEDCNTYFYLVLMFSFLIDADKFDASGTDIYNRPNIPESIVDKYKEEVFSKPVKEIDISREEAYQEINNKVSDINLDEHIYNIELPTGTGKTLAAINFAVKLKHRVEKERNFNPRIIYALPFLSIIDQSEIILKQILEINNLKGTDILLKHNHLSDLSYNTKEVDNLDISKSQLLFESWNSEIILTTFMQLFYSILSNRNRSLRKFHNLTNSIIILDEIQSVPYEYWETINKCLKILSKEFNCWIILMTATQPLIFKENTEVITLINDKNKYYEKFNRIDFYFDLEEQCIEDFKQKAINEVKNNPKKDIMFVLNTKSSSKEIYNAINGYFESDFSNEIDITEDGVVNINEDTSVFYLSGDIIPFHRLNRINEIKKSEKRKIIVTTQLIEAGVDISVDIIYRDLAPIANIIQTAGRCNRNNGKERGKVKIINLKNEKGRKFSSMIYDSLLLNKDILKGITKISEKDFSLKKSKEFNEILLEHGKQNIDTLKDIKELNLYDIQKDFKLIKEDYERIDVFIAVNDEAKKLWNKYEELYYNEKGYNRKNKFLEFKSDFYKYVTSMPFEKLKKNPGTVNFFPDEKNIWLAYLTSYDISRKYDIVNGFKQDNEEDAFII